jgi:cytochrome c-type biogenesis protein CcmE
MPKISKTVIGLIIIAVFLAIGFITFLDSKIEYVNFAEAKDRMSKVEVKGSWVQNKESRFDQNTNSFMFYMLDDNQNEMKVILDGAKPNNFEVAEAVVVKGKMKEDHFHATDILTKCPSKYEADGNEIKNSESKDTY